MKAQLLCFCGRQISLTLALMEGCSLCPELQTFKSKHYCPHRLSYREVYCRYKANVSCVIMQTFLLISHVILGPGSTFLYLAWTLGKLPSCSVRTVTFYMALTARQGKHMMGPSNKNAQTGRYTSKLKSKTSACFQVQEPWSPLKTIPQVSSGNFKVANFFTSNITLYKSRKAKNCMVNKLTLLSLRMCT